MFRHLNLDPANDNQVTITCQDASPMSGTSFHGVVRHHVAEMAGCAPGTPEPAPEDNAPGTIVLDDCDSGAGQCGLTPARIRPLR